jgi:copper transport protein
VAAAFGRRAVLLLGLAVAAGIVVSLLGILLQGASAAGVSLWASLKASILEDTLDSRFGTVWILRAVDWVALGALLAVAWRAPRARRWLAVPIGLGCAYLAATPAFAGHASVESPVVAMFPSDFIHVLAASTWVGGIAFLLIAVPAATRCLEPPGRTALLLAALSRFSPLALAAVVAIALTGIVQAIVDVGSVSALFGTTYGLLVVAKIVALSVLICFGALNRERLIPALRRLAERSRPPGEAGAAARRNLRGELALMIVVFGVTAALVSYAPPVDASRGPFSTTTSIGPAELEMTVEPAKVGANTIHLYLINADDGSPFTKTRQLSVSASLPAQRIGPLKLQVNRAGPGHYVLPGAQLSPGGSWDIELTDRISAFDEYSKTVSVSIG